MHLSTASSWMPRGASRSCSWACVTGCHLSPPLPAPVPAAAAAPCFTCVWVVPSTRTTRRTESSGGWGLELVVMLLLLVGLPSLVVTGC
jgi:hypothetical protein